MQRARLIIKHEPTWKFPKLPWAVYQPIGGWAEENGVWNGKGSIDLIAMFREQDKAVDYLPLIQEYHDKRN